MKFTLSWLKDHLDTKASLKEICDRLTMIGLEVEQVIDQSEALRPFTVAKILHAEKHPQADKLSVCKVESDIGELQIVCGAPNARAGIYVALAKEGTTIPTNGMVIKKTQIRGVDSSGMLCSADELGLGGDAAGIIELPPAKIGESIVKVLGLDDPVIDIAITPNRADALSVHGVARDLAAAGLGALKPLPDISHVKGSFASPVKVNIDTSHCRQFIGAYIKGVKNAPSPDWLQKRLTAIGQKPISALVDITNYMTLDLGRPLHVYDAKKLKGSLTVRDAREGEKLKALNDKEYTLRKGMCVIADEAGAQGIGGVIGGQPTGCDATTTDVFLEVAFFDPAHVAAIGRALQIDSDARYRFERGVDPGFVKTGAELAILMIRELCGGEASELVVTGKAPEWKRSVPLRDDRVATLGGVNVAPDKTQIILKSLGFQPAGSGWQPPSWRGDVEGEADLVEEVLRIHGYDHIPPTPLPKLPGISRPAIDLAQKRAQLARRLLAARGMLECCTWSFLPEAQAKLFGGGDPKLKLVNPIAAELDTMRPSLLPNLLEAARRNIYRGEENLKLFEVGLQFHDIIPSGQKTVATGVTIFNADDYTCFAERIKIPSYLDEIEDENGNEETVLRKIAIKERRGLNASIRQVMALEAKANALFVLQNLGVNTNNIAITTDAPDWYHPGCSGALTLGSKIILGYFGELHPKIATFFDLEDESLKTGKKLKLSNKRLSAFEIFLDAIPVSRSKSTARQPLKLSEFQPTKKDFTFIVDDKISAAEIKKTLEKVDKELITDVKIFDVLYHHPQIAFIPKDMKAISFKVTLQSFERTLTEQDITAVSNAIIAAAAKFGGTLRQ